MTDDELRATLIEHGCPHEGVWGTAAQCLDVLRWVADPALMAQAWWYARTLADERPVVRGERRMAEDDARMGVWAALAELPHRQATAA